MSDNQISINSLRTVVPLNALTVDHLNSLMRNHNEEFLCAGQKLCNRNERDGSYIFLLNGTVRAESASGTELLHADSPASRFPLAHHQPRLQTLICETDCRIIRFRVDCLDSMLAWDQASRYIMLDIASQRDLDEDADWMLSLLQSNLFYKVPPMNIRQILNRFEPCLVEQGDTIIRQGELGDCCYFIKEGVVGVYQSTDPKQAPALVNELSAGRCFGEDALVSQNPRNATLVMHSHGVLMRLDKKDFFRLLKAPPLPSVSVQQLLEQPTKWQLLDVRTQDEFELSHLQSAQHMPLDLLKLKARLLDREKSYLLYCNTGRRSAAAVQLLQEEGLRCKYLQFGLDQIEPGLLQQLGMSDRNVDNIMTMPQSVPANPTGK